MLDRTRVKTKLQLQAELALRLQNLHRYFEQQGHLEHDITRNITAFKPNNNKSKTYQSADLLTPKDTAKLLGLRPKTLANRRSSGMNTPLHINVGGRVMYRYSDILAFIEQHVRRSTSDVGGHHAK